MNEDTNKTDPELLREFVQYYETKYRHPDLPPFTIYGHCSTSIRESVRHPEVLRPGVYACYDHDDKLIYIGESGNPSARTWKHYREARANNRRSWPSIDLITVSEPWERFSLEQFLQTKFFLYRGRWDAWAKREDQLKITFKTP